MKSKILFLITFIFLFSLTFISAQSLIKNGIDLGNQLRGYNYVSDGNESILWNDFSFNGFNFKICAVNSDWSDVDNEECDKYYENGTCEKYKTVKYKYPNKIKLKDKDLDVKFELDIPDDADEDSCLTFPLDLYCGFWCKIGADSITLSGLLGFNSTDTNVTNEGGNSALGSFEHLNTSDGDLMLYMPFDVLDGNGTWVAGNWSGALEFDGTDDYISIPAISFGDTDKWTLSSWIYQTGTKAFEFTFGSDSNQNENFDFDDITGYVYYRNSTNSYHLWNVGEDYKNAWHYFTFTYYGNGTMEMFYDGISQGTNPVGLTSPTFNAFGRGYSTSDYNFEGSIDEVRIFDYALNSTEINELYTSNTLSQTNPTNIISGSNLVTNGNFDSDVSSWNVYNGATMLWDNGVANITMASISPLDRVLQSIGFDTNYYNFTFTISNLELGSGGLVVKLTNVVGGDYAFDITSDGTYSIIRQGTTNTENIELRPLTTGTQTNFSLDNVSLYKVGDQVGYWNLNEIEGLVARDTSGDSNDGDLTGYGDDTRYTYDYTSNSNDGTLMEGVFFNSTAGYYGGAYEFDGVDDYVDLGTGIKDTLSLYNNFTFSAWIYPQSTNEGSFLSSAVASPNRLSMQTAGGKVYIGFYNGAARVGATSESASINNWYNVVFAWDSSTNTSNAYLNGVAFTGSDATPHFSATAKTTLGIHSDGASYPFNGTIDEVMIFNRTLSENEIQQIYNSSFNRFFSTGEMLFTGLNFGSNNTVNISIPSCQTLNGSYLQVKINEGTWENLSGCSFNTYNFISGENFTTRFVSNGFYSPLVIGNISLDDWYVEVITNRTTINENPLAGVHHFGYNYLPYRPSAYGEMQILENNGTTISFPSEDEYVVVWENQTIGHLKSVLFNNGTLTIQKSGNYFVNSIISFRGQTGSTHGFALGVNEIKQEDCYGQRKLGSTDVGTTGFTCIIPLNLGDEINLMASDDDVSMNDITIVASNLNLHREG